MISYLPSISIQAKHMAQEVQNELANLERCNEAHKLQLCFVRPEIFILFIKKKATLELLVML